MAEKKKPTQSSLTAPKPLEVIILIIPRNKAEFFQSVLESFDINVQSMVYGRGTGNLLGLRVEENKAVLIAPVLASKRKELRNALEDKYLKMKNCNGIACFIKMSSMIGVLSYKFIANIKE